MNYCPHCSEPLARPVKTCPNCKKNLDISLLSNLYGPGESSSRDKKAAKKIWFREHAGVLIPLITLVAGIITGAIIMFVFEEMKFKSDKENYEEQINALNATIRQKDAQATSSNTGFQQQLAGKDQIIAILSEELNILGRVLNFTNRFARNSTITANDLEEEDYYRRNLLYLNNQFAAEQQKLEDAGHTTERNFNLLIIPQVFSANPE